MNSEENKPTKGQKIKEDNNMVVKEEKNNGDNMNKNQQKVAVKQFYALAYHPQAPALLPSLSSEDDRKTYIKYHAALRVLIGRVIEAADFFIESNKSQWLMNKDNKWLEVKEKLEALKKEASAFNKFTLSERGSRGLMKYVVWQLSILMALEEYLKVLHNVSGEESLYEGIENYRPGE